MSFKKFNPFENNVRLELISKSSNKVCDFFFEESYLIFDLICYRSGKIRFSDDNGFVVLPSLELKKSFGDNYSGSLQELRDLNLIEVKTFVDCSGRTVSYSKDDLIARSFRITKYAKFLLNKNETSCFKKIEYCYSSPKKKNGRLSLLKKSKNPKHLKLLEAYRKVTIDPNWLEVFQSPACFPPDHFKYPSEPIAKARFFFHSMGMIHQIYEKKLSFSSDSECGRFFHPIIEMSKILRKYVKIDGEKICNIDAKSFHPYLIAYFIKDKNQRENYLNLLKGEQGFYERFVDKTHGRETIKVCLQKFLSGRKPRDQKTLEIQKWFQNKFSDVYNQMKELKKQKKTFQMKLQQLESRLFVDEVFMKAAFWNIPMHDGIGVKQKDIPVACEFIQSVFQKELGYSIPLECDSEFYINSV